jgi:two-component system OmpR family response regulator
LAAINARRRILLVDDDQDTRQLLNNTLAPEGFETVVVAGDEVTPALLNQVEPDLVILDSRVPGVTSFRRLVRIREHTDVPIIMLAASYEMDSLRRAFSLGADDYIRKPFERRAFLARIRAKLRRAGEYSHNLTPVTT